MTRSDTSLELASLDLTDVQMGDVVKVGRREYTVCGIKPGKRRTCVVELRNADMDVWMVRNVKRVYDGISREEEEVDAQ